MYKFFSVTLIALAVSTPAYADIFERFSSTGGPDQIVDGQVYAPTQNGVVDGSMHGYPFYSGCCEPTCGEGLWDGFCGSRGCGLRAHRLGHHGHLKGGFGCGSGCGVACGLGYGHSSCGKGGCGPAAAYGYGYPAFHGHGGKSGFGGHLSHHGFGGKGCGLGGPCGSKGCNPCGPKHCRLGLFDWLHFGHGHGCDVCGDAGCSGCDGGKGGFGKGGYIEHAPAQGYDKMYYGTPNEAQGESTLQPPEVLIEPTSISDRSAWRRQVPANPFARPLSY